MAQRANTLGRPVEGPWVSAIESGEVGNVRALLERGANIEERLFLGKTPVLYAAGTAGWDIVRYLIERGADPSVPDRRGRTVADIAKADSERIVPGTAQASELDAVVALLRRRGLMASE